MNNAIFRSASQAVHFSYVILAYEASPDSIMAKLIRQHMQETGQETYTPSAIDFGGLSRFEVRGQAAMIRSMVEYRLQRPESFALRARYGLTRIRQLAGGGKAFEFSSDRRLCILELADLLSPQFDLHADLLLVLITRAVAEIEQLRPSLRGIADSFGVNHVTLSRKFKVLQNRLRDLEYTGLDQLTPHFQAEGIVPAADQPKSA